MLNLIEFVEPGEAVIWRSQRVWRPLSDSSLLLIPADIVLLPLVFAAELALSTVGRRVPARHEVLLTDRRLLFRAGLCRPAVACLDRADIAALEVFAGDDTVLVHGRGGVVHRATVPGEAVRLAQEAGVTTTLWRSRLPPQARSHLAMRGFFALIFGVGALVLLIVAVLLHPVPLDDARAWAPDSWREEDLIEAGAGIVAGTVLLGGLAGYLVGSMLAYSSVGGQELRALRCWSFHPLWQGRSPPGRLRRVLTAPGGAVRATLDRLFRGPLPDCAAIEPEIIEPGEWENVADDDWQHPIDPDAFRIGFFFD